MSEQQNMTKLEFMYRVSLGRGVDVDLSLGLRCGQL
jgi:hypothetical protein